MFHQTKILGLFTKRGVPECWSKFQTLLLAFLLLLATGGEAMARGASNTVVCEKKEDLIAGLNKVNDKAPIQTSFGSNTWMVKNTSCELIILKNIKPFRKPQSQFDGIYSSPNGFHFPILKFDHPHTGQPVYEVKNEYKDRDWELSRKTGKDRLDARSCKVFNDFSHYPLVYGRNIPWYINIPMHCTDNGLVKLWQIAEFLYEGGAEAALHAHIASLIALKLTDDLAQHNVMVRDLEGFAARLPEKLSQGWGKLLKIYFVNKLLKLSKSDRDVLTSQLHSMPARGASRASDYLPAVVDAQTKRLSNQSFLRDLGLTVVASEVLFLAEKRPHQVSLTAPFMEDILTDSRLFRFPNPTVRNKLIRQIKAASP